jgi:hypothetical protein
VNLDIAASDYYMFGSLKKVLRGGRFVSDDKVKNVVHRGFGYNRKRPSQIRAEGL